jgi:hypothetical protein
VPPTRGSGARKLREHHDLLVELVRLRVEPATRNLAVLPSLRSTDDFGTVRASVSVRATESREVRTMAASIAIEIESGVFTGPVRQHPGYYAGDFNARPTQDESN